MSQQYEYTVTFRITSEGEGNLKAEYKVHHLYADEMADRTLDLHYEGSMGTDMDRDHLERSIRGLARSTFDTVPRPLTVRLVYEMDGQEPEERTFVVREFVPDEED